MNINIATSEYILAATKARIVFTLVKANTPTLKVLTPRGFKKIVRCLNLNMVSYDEKLLVASNPATNFKVIYAKIQHTKRRDVRTRGNDGTVRVPRSKK